MNLERAWMIASALLLIVAAIFLWRNNLSAAFVVAALGACAWFLSYRAQMSSKIVDHESREEPEEEVSTASGSDRATESEDEH